MISAKKRKFDLAMIGVILKKRECPKNERDLEIPGFCGDGESMETTLLHRAFHMDGMEHLREYLYDKETPF